MGLSVSVRRGCGSRSPSAQILAADLKIPVVGQLPMPQLSLDNPLQPGPMQVVVLNTFLGRRPLGKQALKDTARHPDDPGVFDNLYPEVDGAQGLVPSGILRKRGKHCNLLPGRIACSLIVLKY
jgi:hypothetical protein